MALRPAPPTIVSAKNDTVAQYHAPYRASATCDIPELPACDRGGCKGSHQEMNSQRVVIALLKAEARDQSSRSHASTCGSSVGHPGLSESVSG